jgi:flagellar FliJ protein
MGAKAFSSLMENMKSEIKNPALEAALTMKSTLVADLEALIHEFEGTASLLDRRIKAEEARTRIEDPTHFAYSNFAKSARQRRDNLLASAAVLKVKLEEALRQRDDALEQLNRADVPASTQARIAQPRSASTRT